MTDFEFLLSDRLQKIKSMNELYDLEHKAYISFSGGKDSTVLSALFDLALPGNQIPRVYINTGIDYRAIVEFVKEYGNRDGRLQIIKPSQNIKKMLDENGYPFKSKEHSQKVALYQHSGMCKTVSNYLGNGTKTSFLCPDKLKYNFSQCFTLKVSDKCCYKLKKEPAALWSEKNKRPVTITGIRQEEGGLRQSLTSCTVFYDADCKNLHKFHPLLVVSDEWINDFVKNFSIELCKLYYPPYNFKRTGCKGCPYSVDLQVQLNVMYVYFPEERKQCEMIWHKVYEEYRKKNYRLQRTLFDTL